MSKLKKLIGVTGRARCGKDTIASYLIRSYGFERLAFADPVKRAAQEIFALPDSATWDPELKEVVIPFWGLSPRQMFQRLGTDCVRNVFGEDIWLKRWLVAFINNCEEFDFVVPDVRFENEAALIRGRGGVIIHVMRQDAPAINPHISEAGVAYKEGDIVLGNNGTIQELQELVQAVVEGMDMRGERA
jgi:hypothetical protein